MKNLSETNYFVFFFILFFVNPLIVYSYYDSKVYNEAESFIMDQSLAFGDGTLFMNFLKPINETCAEPKFKFRILHPNGTFDTFDFNPQIPEHNFCYAPNGNYLFTIEPSFLLPESLYVLYVNSTDIDSASYYILYITQMGDFISNTYIAPATIVNGTIYDAKIKPCLIGKEYGFIFSKYHEIKPIVIWSSFSKPDEKGNFNLLKSGEIRLDNPLDEYRVFSTISGIYGFLTFTSLNTTELTPNSAFEAFLTFTNKKFSTILFQSSIPDLVNKYNININCNANHYTQTVNSCVFVFKKNNRIWIEKILFNDFGTIIRNNILKIKLNDDEVGIISIIDLFNGGYLLYTCTSTEKNNYQVLNGTILDNYFNYHSTLNFPLYLKASKSCIILTGNSEVAFLIIQDNEISWKVLFTNLPKFLADVGYGNPSINSTYPTINSDILVSTSNINITYNFPITTSTTLSGSTSRILIYQDGNPPLIRQSVFAKVPSYFSFSSDGKTINMIVLNTTFNQPNMKYFVVVEDNAIIETSSNQPLLGIEKYYWNFSTTTNNKIYKFAGEIDGIFYLTADSTKYFTNLSPYKQQEFLSQLKFQLSCAIPININRLGGVKYHGYKNNQLALSLYIKKIRDKYEKNVITIIEELDLLIRKKEITSISQYNVTKLLDENYGFQINDDIFSNNIVYIIIGAIGITKLITFYFYAKKRYPEGDNTVILFSAPMILDIIFDILFIINHGSDLPELLIPSIIFFAFPIAVNLMMSFILILFEIIEYQAFYTWFKNNTIIGILFVILAGIDLKVLNILSSRVAGIMIFNVDLSERAKSIIFWGNLIGLFIEDIPQFIIQVLYKKETVIYNIIPIVTMAVTSSILLGNVMVKIYKLCEYFEIFSISGYINRRRRESNNNNIRRHTI